ncbi:MAG: flagellar basal body rod protein FlgC [Deltaproteobacteria bacterium]|nr:flagellar basal body rod protein FlgC [Deltaproteobacteria bacterium]
MTFIPSFKINASGLHAQKIKMDLSSANLANAQTTKAADGQPYRKATPIFEAVPLKFDEMVGAESQMMDGVNLETVEFRGVSRDDSPFKRVYDPSHPDADQTGFVKLPNINLMSEMADMLLASRAYEANVTAFNTTKNMALKVLDLGKA